MLAVYKKELRGYLTSMIGYVFIAFVLAIVGVYFTAYNLTSAYPEFGVTLSAVSFVFLIITPVLTMRILAEEKKQKTDQLLFTAPVSVWKIVCGKYLGMVTILFIPMAIICTYPLIMGKYGTISYPMAYTAIFGFFLMGCGNIAVGLFLSSITESQIIAAVLTFAVLFVCNVIQGIESFIAQTASASLVSILIAAVIICLIIYRMTKDTLVTSIAGIIMAGATFGLFLWKSSLFEGAIQKFMEIFNITGHFDGFVGGIFDLSGIVYMLSIILIFVFLTVQSIQKRRWS